MTADAVPRAGWWPAAVMLAGCLAGASADAGIRIKGGLATMPGTFRYATLHAATGTFTERREPFRLGATAIQGEIVQPLGGGFAAGLSVGAGIPFQKPALDHTRLYEPAPGGVNPLEGDSTVGVVAPVSLFVTLGWSAPIAGGEAGVSVGGGVMLVSVASRTTDQWWTTPLGPGASRLTTADPAFATVTAWSNDSLALPAIQAAPAWHFHPGGGHRLGIEAPLGFAAKRTMSGSRTDPLPSSSVTTAADPASEFGGLVWNVLLVYSRAVD